MDNLDSKKGQLDKKVVKKGKTYKKMGKGWSRRYACFGISVLGLEMRFDKMGLA